MPHPPLLPPTDDAALFASGQDFRAWLAEAENDEHREDILASVEGQRLDALTVAVLRALTRPVHVIALAEDWCPDVVRHVPVLERLQRASEA